MIKWCPLIRQIIDTHTDENICGMVIIGGGGGKEGLFVSRLNLPDPPIELFDNLVISPHRRLTGSYFYIFPPPCTLRLRRLNSYPFPPENQVNPPKNPPAFPTPALKK